MKYKLGYIIPTILFFFSCSAIDDNVKMGSLYTESQLNIDVHPISEGSNKIILNNNTPNVGGMWDYGIGRSTRKTDTIALPFIGIDTIHYYATTPGGVVKVNRIVSITKIDYPSLPQYEFLAGSSILGKTWVWALDIPAGNGGGLPDAPRGNGPYLMATLPQWWHATPQRLNSFGIDKDSMIFDLNGKANFTLITHNPNTDGNLGLPAGVYHGTFKFDMLKTKMSLRYPDKLWSIGEITFTNATIPYATSPSDGDTNPNQLIYTFDILRLDNDVMVLAYGDPQTFSSGNPVAWYWVFKRSGYSFQ